VEIAAQNLLVSGLDFRKMKHPPAHSVSSYEMVFCEAAIIYLAEQVAIGFFNRP
jgi:hypothetical protein